MHPDKGIFEIRTKPVRKSIIPMLKPMVSPKEPSVSRRVPPPVKADGYADRSMRSQQVHLRTMLMDDPDRRRSISTGPTWPYIFYTHILI